MTVRVREARGRGWVSRILLEHPEDDFLPAKLGNSEKE